MAAVRKTTLRIYDGEVDKSPRRISRNQLDGDTIANVKALPTLHHHSIDVGIESAHKGSVLVDAGDDAAEVLPDAGMEYHGGDPLLHLAFHFAGLILHHCAPLRDGIEIVFGVGLRCFEDESLQNALRHHVRKSAVGRGGMRVVVDREPEVAG